MDKAQKKRFLIRLGVILAVLIVGIILTAPLSVRHETITEVMKDAVLHDVNKISLFGLIDVDPSYIAGLIVTVLLLVFAAAFIVYYLRWNGV